MNKNRKGIFAFIGISAALIALLIFNKVVSKDSVTDIFTEVEKGSFMITVSAAGELIPEKAIDIIGPSLPIRNTRGRGGHSRIRATDLKISDLVPEGTIVNKGDYIGQLDRTSYDNTLKDQVERLKEMEININMKILDTTVVLTNLRDVIKNQTFTVEEATITLEKSQFEPPSTIRKAEIDLDKSKRKLIQLKKQYNLRSVQKIRELNNLKTNIANQKTTVEDLQTYLAGFTIAAPSPGMIVYKRNRNGTKRKTGSTLNPFDMVIATLPDLSSMISKTYVSEIDVSKVKNGQTVNVSVDAFPDENFSGTVLSIAKIGEQMPNSDTKMFEVQSTINGSDSRLRPSMTTGNEIIINSFDDAVFIPLECVHTESDGIPFVYTKSRTKQVVLLGDSNEKYVIVNQGLKSGTEIYLLTPDDHDKFKLEGETLIPLIGQSL